MRSRPISRNVPSLLMPALVAIAVLAALAAPADASGILAPTDQALPPLRVTDHLVDVTVRDGLALTHVSQVFKNDSQRRLEATYVFPLPEQADLTDFQMSFNGKMVKGRVLPADEAARIYESIVRQAKDPGLIEFIGRRLLQMRVFPIEPNSETRIEVRYQQVCRPISGMTGYHYPLRTRKTSGQAYGTVRFAVELETGAPLKNIWSPTHAVEIVRDANERSARIAYEASGGSLEDDFLLLYATDSSDLGLSAITYKPNENDPGHFVAMLTPKQLWPDDSYQPQDVVFVIDTSGSMAGDKLDQAKAALKFCIDSLDKSDRFGVVRFSTGFDVLFEPVVAATKEKKADARDWIDDFQSAGGTNIADTLKYVMKMRPSGDGGDDDAEGGTRPFVIVFLTDGRGNRDAATIMNTLAEAGVDKTGLRVFPFGVGHDVNTKVIDRLADEFTGRPTYVQPGENLELVLGDFFSVISRPVLTNLEITLPVAGVTERFPAVLGDLYHGQQIVIAGRFREEATGPVRLTAMRGGERLEYSWPDVAFTHTASAEYVPSVWAGRKIAYLIDEIRAHGESSEMIEEILALSLEYGIQTPYSSWLVDPERRGAPGQPVILGGGDPQGPRRRPHGVPRVPPGARSGGGGFGGGVDASPAEAREWAQARRLRAVDASVAGELSANGAESFFLYGDEFGDIDLMLAEGAVTEEAGKKANVIARKNAELRDLRSKDEGRIQQKAMLYRKLGDRWYNRLGRVLVDERFGETTKIVVVRFASDAYFEIVRERADLRAALAASRTIVVMPSDEVAILVSERVGKEEFSDEDRQEIGLVGRSSD